ncbi:MAG: hypothetical protein M0Q38_07350 [Bacteroidales bacterium]|nr:hypothetical protein [Bacteroidales bacterium]
MGVLKRGDCLLLLFALFLPVSLSGQYLVLKDTILLVPLSKLAEPEKSVINFRFTQAMEYSLTASNLLLSNWQQTENSNQFTFLQNFKYSAQLFDDHFFKITNIFLHNLGIQIFFDSLTKIAFDDNTLDTRIEFKFGRSVNLTFLSNLSTRFFNGYDYQSDGSGSVTRTPASSFLTPLIWTFSGGIGIQVPRFLMLNFGLSAARLTWIRNKKRLESSGRTDFFGVPKEKDHLFEFGLSMHLLVDKNLGNWGNWNCDVLIFKNYNKPVDLVLKNLIGIKINKFIKTCVQTRLIYEEDVSKTLQMENLISIGFNIRL